MSVLGTGVIAGVAQTALQAQQVARQRLKPLDDRERARLRISEVLDLRLHGMGEDDDAAASSTALHADAVLPEHPRQNPPDRPIDAVQPEPAPDAHHESLTSADDPASPAPLGPPAGQRSAPANEAAVEPDALAAAAYRSGPGTTPVDRPHRLDVEA